MSHVLRRPGLVVGTKLAVLLGVVHAVNDVLTAVIGVLLPTVQARFAASTTTLSLLVAAFTISSSVTQPVLGALAERAGLRRIAALGVALAAVTLSLLAVAPSLPVLFVLLVFGGLGSAALHPVGSRLVSGPTARRPALAVGLFTAGGMVGFAAGPVLVLFLISRYGTGVTPWLMLPGLALAALMVKALPDFEPHHGARLTQLVDLRLLRGPLGLLTAAATLISLAFLTVVSAAPLWLVNERGQATDAPLLGLTLAVFSLTAALGAVVGGALAPRLGDANTTAGSVLAAVVPLTAMVLLPTGVPTLLAAAAGGLLLYASQPILIVAAQKTTPDSPVAAAGIVIGLGHGAAGLLYVGAGVLQDAIGLAPAMLASFLLLFPAAVLAARGLRLTPELQHGRARRRPGVSGSR